MKVTPAHDPNDFEAGLRHNLPQIEVMDEQAHMNENAGPYAGLDRYEARKRVLEDLRQQGFLVGEKDYTISIGKCDRCGTVVEPRLSTQWFIKIEPLAERAIEAVEKGEITIVPENYQQIYLNWMHNIHDWCISRQLWWGHRIPAWHCALRRNHCGARDSGEVREVRRLEAEAGYRRAGHLVFVGLAAVYDAGLAGEDARSGSFLSDDAADYGLRHSVFLGGAHDHVWLPLHGGASSRIRG